MRLTRAGEYAIRCFLYLSSQETGKVVTRNEIATAMDIPRDFLTKIAQQLSRNNIIEITQGAKGGYRLISSPGKLSLLDVIEVMMGEIFFNDCLVKTSACSNSPFCPVHRVWEQARVQFRETLKAATFEQLTSDAEQLISKAGEKLILKATEK